MTDKKLTDEEIIKALEDYINENEFEYFHSNMVGEYPLIRKSLDIINRQKAEIEKLKSNYRKLCKYAEKKEFELTEINANVSGFREAKISRLAPAVKKIKTEAYQEFANKLKEKCGIFTPLGVNWIEEVMAVRVSDIDKILKEMVGKEK